MRKDKSKCHGGRDEYKCIWLGMAMYPETDTRRRSRMDGEGEVEDAEHHGISCEWGRRRVRGLESGEKAGAPENAARTLRGAKKDRSSSKKYNESAKRKTSNQATAVARSSRLRFRREGRGSARRQNGAGLFPSRLDPSLAVVMVEGVMLARSACAASKMGKPRWCA